MIMFRLRYSMGGEVSIETHEVIEETTSMVRYRPFGESVLENRVGDGVRWFRSLDDAIVAAELRLDCNQDRVDRMQMSINRSRAALKEWTE